MHYSKPHLIFSSLVLGTLCDTASLARLPVKYHEDNKISDIHVIMSISKNMSLNILVRAMLPPAAVGMVCGTCYGSLDGMRTHICTLLVYLSILHQHWMVVAASRYLAASISNTGLVKSSSNSSTPTKGFCTSPSGWSPSNDFLILL